MASKFVRLDNLAKWMNRYRPWVHKKVFKNANKNCLLDKNQLNFTLMSYNILSEDNMLNNPDLYSLCSPAILKWPERGQRILQEIGIVDPDILCLQEVYIDHYTDFYKPELQRKGYDVIFNPREFKFDGCALFFKKNKFNLLKSKEINYHREDLMKILDRPNVGLIAMLEPVGNQNSKIDNRLIVATTHILFNTKRGDIKLAQVRLLLAEMERMALRKIDENGVKSYHPFIIAGDFNLLPGSPIYQFIERGVLDCKNLDYHVLSGHISSNRKSITEDRINIRTVSTNTVFLDDSKTQDVNKSDLVDDRMNVVNNQQTRTRNQFNSSPSDNHVLTHGLSLRSVFDALNGNQRRYVTTKHDRACEMVDYIFYHQTKELNLLGFRKLLNEDRTFDYVPYLPNGLIGSDHFSLIAKFSLHGRKV